MRFVAVFFFALFFPFFLQAEELPAFYLAGSDVYHLKISSKKQFWNREGTVVGFDLFAYTATQSPWTGFLTTHVARRNLTGRRWNGLTVKSCFLERWAEGRLGYHWQVGKSAFTPYLGFGYYALDDRWDLAEVVVHVKNFYVPLGLFFSHSLSSCVALGVDSKGNLPLCLQGKVEGHPALHGSWNSLDWIPSWEVASFITYHRKIHQFLCTARVAPYLSGGKWTGGRSFPSATFFRGGVRVQIGALF